MSIALEISRLQQAKGKIKDKCVELGIATSVDKLDTLAEAVDGISNRGVVNAEVKEGESFSIQEGYYKGGTVSGVAGGGNYTLQDKTVTPTKSEQVATKDDGYYGLNSVTVNPIPDAYQDVSGVTAGAEDVLANKIIVSATGERVAGTMTNQGAVSKTLDATTGNQSYTVPKGYHNGSGAVRIALESKSTTPTESAQTVTPTAGKVLSSVTVQAIPAKYADASAVTGSAEDVLSGKKLIGYDADTGKAVTVTGTMTNHGAVTETLTTAKTSYTVPKGYHSGSGTVSITTETKTVTPTKSTQNIAPTTGKLLSGVTVSPIPDAYQDVTGVTATAAAVLSGSKFVDKTGALVTGTMANNGSTGGSIDGLTVSSYTIPAGYTTGGTVTLDNSIETVLAAI